MNPELDAEPTSVAELARGLHVVRYVSAADPQDCPIATLRPEAPFLRVVELLSEPDAPLGQLTQPGECLVVRALENARLEIAVRRRPGGVSLEASFRVEALSAARPGAVRVSEAPPAPVEEKAPPRRLPDPIAPSRHLVHVARRGDVPLGWDQWAGGPQTPAPVEGLELAPGSQMQVQALVAGAEGWSDWAGPGAFVGTRGRGLPLLGLRLRMTGPNAETLEASAEALFLGATVLVRRGREIEFLSPSGREPLVGLKLSPPQPAPAPAAWPPPPTKLRVFRNLAAN